MPAPELWEGRGRRDRSDTKLLDLSRFIGGDHAPELPFRHCSCIPVLGCRRIGARTEEDVEGVFQRAHGLLREVAAPQLPQARLSYVVVPKRPVAVQIVLSGRLLRKLELRSPRWSIDGTCVPRRRVRPR